jgi:hypothetical protein
MPKSIARLAIGLALTGGIACDRTAADDPLSASGLPALGISGEPVLTLKDDGTPEKQFSGISVRRMPTGDIVVADQATSAIHLFARDGALRSTLARAGDGPGELRGPVLITSHADTIFTFGQPPMSPADVNVFIAANGFHSRSRPSAAGVNVLTVVDRLSTGELVVRRGSVFRALNAAPELGTLVPDSIVLGLFSSSRGREPGTVVWFAPLIRHWMHAYPWRSGGPLTTGLAPYTLGPKMMVVASGDRLWFIDGATGTLRAVDGAGQEVSVHSISISPDPYDRPAVDRARAQALAGATREIDSAKAVAMYDPKLLPPMQPLLSGAHAGAAGGLWVRLFDLDERAAQRFLVVDRDGREIGRATVAAGLSIQHIGSDFVLGVRRDSLGVESVVEHRIGPAK